MSGVTNNIDTYSICYKLYKTYLTRSCIYTINPKFRFISNKKQTINRDPYVQHGCYHSFDYLFLCDC